MPDETYHLPTAATVVLTDDTGGRTRVTFDAGTHTPAREHEALALAHLAKLGRTVPTGDVESVQAWVGDDLNRAAAALEVEQQRTGGARKTLGPWLTERLAQPDDATHDDTGDADGIAEEDAER